MAKVGDRIQDRYRLLRQLGAGGMAEVWLGRGEGYGGFEKLVAIKLLRPFIDNVSGEEFVLMFLDEARLAARLAHPNIVQVFDFGNVEDQYFLVMEYVAGSTVLGLLHHLAKKGRRLPPQLATYVTMQLLAALDYVHRQKNGQGELLRLVHRDVCPQNVLVARDSGAVKLVDFGVAHAVGTLHMTDQGIVKGKLRRMSPEQMAGRELDGRADVFATGLLLYEMLIGSKEFDKNWVASDGPLLRSMKTLPSKLVPDLDPRLDEVVQKAIAPKLQDRYASAREMIDALSPLAGDANKAARDLADIMSELAHVEVPEHGAIHSALERALGSGSEKGGPPKPTAPPAAKPAVHGDQTTAEEVLELSQQDLVVSAAPRAIKPSEPTMAGPEVEIGARGAKADPYDPTVAARGQLPRSGAERTRELSARDLIVAEGSAASPAVKPASSSRARAVVVPNVVELGDSSPTLERSTLPMAASSGRWRNVVLAVGFLTVAALGVWIWKLRADKHPAAERPPVQAALGGSPPNPVPPAPSPAPTPPTPTPPTPTPAVTPAAAMDAALAAAPAQAPDAALLAANPTPTPAGHPTPATPAGGKKHPRVAADDTDPLPDQDPEPADTTPQPPGTLVVSSDRVAEIVIDNQRVGKTPYRATLPAGDHRLRIDCVTDGQAKAGYPQGFTITSGKTVRIDNECPATP